jgi:hypothetical protein
MIHIFVTTRFEGYHRWRDAPDMVSFLREWHRHIFHVKVVVNVEHGDRDVEFIMLKWVIENYVRDKYQGQQFEFSCEAIAGDIMDHFRRFYSVSQVMVSEDGENGAIVTKD